MVFAIIFLESDCPPAISPTHPRDILELCRCNAKFDRPLKDCRRKDCEVRPIHSGIRTVAVGFSINDKAGIRHVIHYLGKIGTVQDTMGLTPRFHFGIGAEDFYGTETIGVLRCKMECFLGGNAITILIVQPV